MRSIHNTIIRLSALQSRMPDLAGYPVDERLQRMEGFGSNPGALLARTYVPPGLGAGAPLVVVLHGCTQSASSYNRGASWTSAADEYGFALLFPEQQRSNNPKLCFNWFSPEDAARGSGEAQSIVQMVRAMCSRHALDPARVFVTGLSAGGAMTAVMLATYPDVFAGGAVIAGLPFGTATSVPEAFDRMRGHGGSNAGELTNLVRSASRHDGEWPRLSVWHGDSDRTVDASNAAALVDQWRGLHRLAERPASTEMIDGQLRRVWRDERGADVIEEYVIGDMGHGTPIDAGEADGGELAGPYMLDVGISSTRRIVEFWGLEGARRQATAAASPPRLAEPVDALPCATITKLPLRPASSALQPSRVQDVIEKALRSAGLMK